MSKLLYVTSSPRGEASESTALAETFLAEYRSQHPDLEVDHLDLWDGSLPVYGGKGAAAKLMAIGGQTPTGEIGEAWAEVQAVFDRFNAAEIYLFTVPMWNAGVPWVLKHLIDTITQPGMCFGFDRSSGYTPLVTGRRAVVVYTSGVYQPGVPLAFGTDFHATFFGDWLRFIGITEVAEIRFQPTVQVQDHHGDRAKAHERARQTAATFDRERSFEA
jgi:FMN-dependent NADH-azoreductase